VPKKKKKMAYCAPGEEAQTKAKLLEEKQKRIRKKLGLDEGGSQANSSVINDSNMSISYWEDDSMIGTDANKEKSASGG
jgi:hypothetical protein